MRKSEEDSADFFTSSVPDEICDAIDQGERFLLTSHIRSDADSVGSELGLKYLLEELGKEVQIANHGGIDERYLWLTGSEEITSPAEVDSNFDSVICLDCATWSRLASTRDLVNDDHHIINIDHHRSNECYGDLNWIHPDASSVGEMIYTVWTCYDYTMPKEAVIPMYTALVADTGSFAFASTTPRSHEIASELMKYDITPERIHERLFSNFSIPEMKLMGYILEEMQFSMDGRLGWCTLSKEVYEEVGTEPWGSQPYIQELMRVKGVEVALLLRQLISRDRGGKPEGVYKGSLRSRGNVNVSEVAAEFDGGGHKYASGFVVEDYDSMSRVERYVVGHIEEMMESKFELDQD